MLKEADGEETWKIHTTGLINNQVSSELKIRESNMII